MFKKEKVSKAEQDLYYVVNGQGGSFNTSLFETITKADITNQSKLSLGFPEFVEVVQRYQNESGYWKSIQLRISGKNDI